MAEEEKKEETKEETVEEVKEETKEEIKEETKEEIKLAPGADSVDLTEEEKSNILAKQNLLDRNRMFLSTLRLQYLASERRVLDSVEKVQNDFLDYLKNLSVEKGIPQGEDWIYDQNTMSFKKQAK